MSTNFPSRHSILSFIAEIPTQQSLIVMYNLDDLYHVLPIAKGEIVSCQTGSAYTTIRLPHSIDLHSDHTVAFSSRLGIGLLDFVRHFLLPIVVAPGVPLDPILEDTVRRHRRFLRRA